jgi:hypothetical protein
MVSAHVDEAFLQSRRKMAKHGKIALVRLFQKPSGMQVAEILCVYDPWQIALQSAKRFPSDWMHLASSLACISGGAHGQRSRMHEGKTASSMSTADLQGIPASIKTHFSTSHIIWRSMVSVAIGSQMMDKSPADANIVALERPC